MADVGWSSEGEPAKVRLRDIAQQSICLESEAWRLRDILRLKCESLHWETDQSTIPAAADAFIIAGPWLSSLRTALKDSPLATKLPAK